MDPCPVRFVQSPMTDDKVVNDEWIKWQIVAFADHASRIYKPYATFLEEVLRQVAHAAAPLAIVQSRVKGMASFAEKAAIKAVKYEDEPIYQMTDLCGARMILQTADEVRHVHRLIVHAFDIDEANSVDARSRLKSDQFGYAGYHIIVRVKTGCEAVMGVPVPEALRTSIREDRFDRPRAEIQIRTIAEHVWADTFHDRMYKTSVKVPDEYKRDAARIAAVLEDADSNAGALVRRVDAFAQHFAAYMTADEIRRKIDILKVIYDNSRNAEEKHGIALRIAGMYLALGSNGQVVELLANHANAPAPVGWAIRWTYGAALCRQAAGGAHGRAEEGRRLLTDLEADPECVFHLRAAAAAELGASLSGDEGRQRDTLDWHRKAMRHAPDNPYYLVNYLEFNAYVAQSRDMTPVQALILERALATCRDHVRVGIELPLAYSTMGRLLLLLGRGDESLHAYAKTVEFCRSQKSCRPGDRLDVELRFLGHLNFGRDWPVEHQVVRQFLLLSKAVHGDGDALDQIKSMTIRKDTPKRPIVMLVGGAGFLPPDGADRFRDALTGALADFPGTVIGGGTRAGVPGILGDIVAALRARQGVSCLFDAIGYLPAMIPTDAEKDERSYRLFKTKGHGFSAMEPLQGWLDIIGAGVKPSDVRVLGFDGGRIAAVEYRMALALGATVCVVSDSGREAATLMKDVDWMECPNLIGLPSGSVEAMTLRALLYPMTSDIDENKLEELGREVHERFCAKNPQVELPLSRQPWDNLRDDFKRDSMAQPTYAPQVLRLVGYDVVSSPPPITLATFSDEEVERMAEAEHGRWVIHRLISGWRYGNKADKQNQISPSICAWNQLPEDVKDFDRYAVLDFPAILAKAGLRIEKKRRA